MSRRSVEPSARAFSGKVEPGFRSENATSAKMLRAVEAALAASGGRAADAAAIATPIHRASWEEGYSRERKTILRRASDHRPDQPLRWLRGLGAMQFLITEGGCAEAMQPPKGSIRCTTPKFSAIQRSPANVASFDRATAPGKCRATAMDSNSRSRCAAINRSHGKLLRCSFRSRRKRLRPPLQATPPSPSRAPAVGGNPRPRVYSPRARA